ncbi:MAG: hypothetical protein HYY10_00105 [Candidatus Liptonbacteria bacterium]|nr:hypothetical protein [Candidatus Liptonbacteria bacterium]
MRKGFVLGILIVIAAAMAIAVWPREEKKPTEGAWSPPSSVPSATFRGPVGAPFIVGPTEPPPGANLEKIENRK